MTAISSVPVPLSININVEPALAGWYKLRSLFSPNVEPTLVGWYNDRTCTTPTLVGWYEDRTCATPASVGWNKLRSLFPPNVEPTSVGWYKDRACTTPASAGWYKLRSLFSPTKVGFCSVRSFFSPAKAGATGLLLLFPFLAWADYPVRTYGCASGGEVEISVLRYRRHASILIRNTLIPPTKLPEADPYRRETYLEIGWGDEEIFTIHEEDETFLMDVKSVFLPRPAVLEFKARSEPIPEVRLNLRLSNTGFDALLGFVSESIQRDEAGRVQIRTPRKVGWNPFTADLLASTQIVPAPRSCNRWVGMALERAGCAVEPFWALTPNGLWRQLLVLPRVDA